MGNGIGHLAALQLPKDGDDALVPVNPLPQGVIYPVRDFRPRGFAYSRAQKERAVRLLNMGIPCRQVARMIGPRCSSGSPIRWRQQAQRQAQARRRLEDMMRQQEAP